MERPISFLIFQQCTCLLPLNCPETFLTASTVSKGHHVKIICQSLNKPWKPKRCLTENIWAVMWDYIVYDMCPKQRLVLACTSMQSDHCLIVLDKRDSLLIFWLFLHKNLCCGYSLEVPHWGTSNEYPQHRFSWKNKKTINTSWLVKVSYLVLWVFIAYLKKVIHREPSNDIFSNGGSFVNSPKSFLKHTVPRTMLLEIL